jgi:hypothetical protein
MIIASVAVLNTFFLQFKLTRFSFILVGISFANGN